MNRINMRIRRRDSMRSTTLKSILKTAMLAMAGLLLTAGASFAQQQVNLTAAPTTTTLPDGTTVPMWGYNCGALGVGVISTATCAPLNPNAPAAIAATATTAAVPAGWSPVVITVPAGQSLQINLTNSLVFGANSVPTSLTIVGQLGGGLGTTATSTGSPDHSMAQQTTWPIANPGVAANTPPAQSPRVQSFSTEVAAGATTALTWTAPRPGTYLIESGTHPSIQGPMGLYGILVVTTAPGTTAGCAYPGATATAACVVPYNAEVPVEFSEIDPVQNKSVQAAVTTAGFSETMVWSGQPGGCG